MPHIPKDFVNGIRINSGPFEGILAKPCLCGFPCKEGDDCVLVGSSFGDFYLMHLEHAPAGVMPGHGDSDEEY